MNFRHFAKLHLLALSDTLFLSAGRIFKQHENAAFQINGLFQETFINKGTFN
jgi:hypothetical protein